MSKSKLLISEMAISDLELHWKQALTTGSIKEADELYTHLISQLRKIANNFTIGKSIENTRDGYRVLQMEEYHIYYRADLVNTVEVIRILNLNS